MRGRTSNPKYQYYSDYGGRGISVCDEWHTFRPFRDWAKANGYMPDLSIERINNDGNYEPSNCKWATTLEQANNKRNNLIIEFEGQRHTLAEWSRIYGIKYSTLKARIRNGMPAKQAFAKR